MSGSGTGIRRAIGGCCACGEFEAVVELPTIAAFRVGFCEAGNSPEFERSLW